MSDLPKINIMSLRIFTNDFLNHKNTLISCDERYIKLLEECINLTAELATSHIKNCIIKPRFSLNAEQQPIDLHFKILNTIKNLLHYRLEYNNLIETTKLSKIRLETLNKNIKELNNKFNCPICFETIECQPNEPYNSSSELEETINSRIKIFLLCGHIFCFNCIYTALQYNGHCPLCRFESNDLFSII